MFKEKDPRSLLLAKSQIEQLWKECESLFNQTSLTSRLELSIPSVNYILSGHYSGSKSGMALGKLYNIFGPESVGKSAFCWTIARDFVNHGGNVLWVDAERSVDQNYASMYGIDIADPSQFILCTPDFGEQGYDVMETFAKEKVVNLIVLDSFSALSTKRIWESSADKSDVASPALRLNVHFQKIIKYASDFNVTVMYINQIRDNLVSMGPGGMQARGKKYTGGNPMKFYPHVAIEFKRPSDITKGAEKEYIGHTITLEVEKNKTAVPHLKTVLSYFPEVGFSKEWDILSLAVENGVLSQKGNFTYFNDEFIGNGIDACRKKLETSPELLDELWAKTAVLLDPPERENIDPIELQESEFPDGMEQDLHTKENTIDVKKKRKNKAS